VISAETRSPTLSRLRNVGRAQNVAWRAELGPVSLRKGRAAGADDQASNGDTAYSAVIVDPAKPIRGRS
jgi:hypothetical protein